MAISKYLTVTIKGEKSSLDEKMYVYYGDVGVDFYFQINSLKYEFLPNTQQTTRETINLISDLNNAWASVRVMKPDSSVFTRDKLPIVNNCVKFTITQDITDELIDIGKYLLQIHLYDGEAQNSNRITIPPFNFEVKKLL